ncbi:unnamed protein product [Mucor hiemalis]
MTNNHLTYQYPNEIFDNISYYLTAKQKGVCQAVCRSWRILFIPSQYRYIKLEGRRQFNQFYNSLNPNFLGYYVRRLSVDDVYMTTQELDSLPALCPNLVELSFNDVNTLHDPNLFTQAFSYWKNLRRLTGLQDLTAIKYFLQSPSSPLSSLTYLSISFQAHDVSFREDLLRGIRQAKNLQNLSLDYAILALSHVEAIHDACPNLQKLQLTNTKLEPIGHTVHEKRAVAKQVFSPALSMETFEFKNGGDLYQDYEWLYYFSLKYPNLIKLELWCEYSVNTPDPEVLPTATDLEERWGALASLGMRCFQLKSVKLLNITMNQWLFQAMDHVGTQLEDIALGDMSDNTIDILQYLGQCNQNVSSLTLWGWPSLCIPETMAETISVLGRCSDRLSSVTFSMQFSGIKNSPMPIDLLLSSCSKLKYLKLDNTQVTLVSSIDRAKDALNHNKDLYVRPQLYHISFENGSFRNVVFEYLALRCPNLAKLEITSCALIEGHPSEKEVKIHMPHHAFESISINFIRPPSSHYHLKQAKDICLFDVSQMKNNDLHRVYELVDYEKFTSNLTFNYEQKQSEFTRPTKYVNYGNLFGADECSGPLVSIQCHVVTEFKIGGLWVI